MLKFRTRELEALFDALNAEWGDAPDFEQLLRDAHLGIALSDAGRPLSGKVDDRVAALVERYRPRD